MKRILSSGVSFIASIACASAVQAATITVNAGGNLQSAHAARPGDTIVLQAGAVFTGDFTLPAKGGADYITIRSSAPDGSLPPAGSRITPSSAPLLAKIRSTSAGPAFRTAAGASYWRFLFLEIFPSSSTSSSNLVEFGSFSQTTLASVPHHLVMDRCYLHGDPGFGQRRGVALNSAHTEIANSYFSDFKGVNQDTQAVGGSNGPGPFVIDNNYIEAAGENIMFGGSDPKIPYLVPANIAIRRNLVTKPLAWRMQAWSVKNLIELKNAEAVLIEGNIIENNWAAGQSGYAFMFTPRNQEGTAPWSVVRNVTVQNNVIRHVAAVVNVLGTDNVRPSQQTTGIVIRNNLAYDVSTAYGSAGHPANGWFGRHRRGAERHHHRPQHGRQRRRGGDRVLRQRVERQHLRVRADEQPDAPQQLWPLRRQRWRGHESAQHVYARRDRTPQHVRGTRPRACTRPGTTFPR